MYWRMRVVTHCGWRTSVGSNEHYLAITSHIVTPMRFGRRGPRWANTPILRQVRPPSWSQEPSIVQPLYRPVEQEHHLDVGKLRQVHESVVPKRSSMTMVLVTAPQLSVFAGSRRPPTTVPTGTTAKDIRNLSLLVWSSALVLRRE